MPRARDTQHVSNVIVDQVREAYSRGGSEATRYERAMGMIRHELMKLTDQERKKDQVRARQIRLSGLRDSQTQLGPGSGTGPVGLGLAGQAGSGG